MADFFEQINQGIENYQRGQHIGLLRQEQQRNFEEREADLKVGKEVGATIRDKPQFFTNPEAVAIAFESGGAELGIKAAGAFAVPQDSLAAKTQAFFQKKMMDLTGNYMEQAGDKNTKTTIEMQTVGSILGLNEKFIAGLGPGIPGVLNKQAYSVIYASALTDAKKRFGSTESYIEDPEGVDDRLMRNFLSDQAKMTPEDVTLATGAVQKIVGLDSAGLEDAIESGEIEVDFPSEKGSVPITVPISYFKSVMDLATLRWIREDINGKTVKAKIFSKDIFNIYDQKTIKDRQRYLDRHTGEGLSGLERILLPKRGEEYLKKAKYRKAQEGLGRIKKTSPIKQLRDRQEIEE